MSLQLSSEQSISDVWMAQIDRPEESSTSEVQRLQKLKVLSPQLLSVRGTTPIGTSADRREHRGSSHLPSREAPAVTVNGEPDMPL